MFYEWFEEQMETGGNAVVIEGHCTILRCNEVSEMMYRKLVSYRLACLNRLLSYNRSWFKTDQ